MVSSRYAPPLQLPVHMTCKQAYLVSTVSVFYSSSYDSLSIVHWSHLDVDENAAAGSALIDLGIA